MMVAGKYLLPDSTPHIIRMKPGKGDGKIIMKTSEGEIHLKPRGEQIAWIYGNTIRYDDSMENKLFWNIWIVNIKVCIKDLIN